LTAMPSSFNRASAYSRSSRACCTSTFSLADHLLSRR
jgi:hypothetical protein